MKRASLKVVPTPAPTEPSDLTDRLLDREAERTPPAPAAQATPPAASQRPPRRPKSAPPAPAAEPAAPPAVKEAHAAAPPAPEDGAGSLAAALDQAQAASEALEASAQTSPARYSVALRYRLEALAQHLRQVAEFVKRVNPQ